MSKCTYMAQAPSFENANRSLSFYPLCVYSLTALEHAAPGSPQLLASSFSQPSAGEKTAQSVG